MEDLLTLLNLVISLILTWGAGLAIPLLLRFVIIKNPIKRSLAIVITVANFMLNLGLWIYIGMASGDTTSKTHMVQYVMAIISYIILSKGSVDSAKDKVTKSGKINTKDLKFRDFSKK